MSVPDRRATVQSESIRRESTIGDLSGHPLTILAGYFVIDVPGQTAYDPPSFALSVFSPFHPSEFPVDPVFFLH